MTADLSCTITNTRRVAPILKISHRNVSANASGALIVLRCVGKSGSCKGTISLQATDFGSRLQAGAASAKLKPVSFNLAAGKSKGYRTPLPSRTRSQLKRKGKAVARAVAKRSTGKAVKRLVTVFPGSGQATRDRSAARGGSAIRSACFSGLIVTTSRASPSFFMPRMIRPVTSTSHQRIP